MEYRAEYLWNDEQVKKETQNQVLVIAGACLAGLAVIMGTVLGVYYYRMEKPKNNTFIHIQRKRVKIPALEQVVVKGMPTARVKEYVVPSALPTAPLDQLDYALPSAPLDHLGYAPSSGRSSIRDSCSIAPESSISQAAPLPVIPHRKASQDTELVLLPKQVSNLKTPVSASRPFSFQNTPSDMIGTFVDFDPMSEVGVSVDVPVRSKIPVPREL
jgi:hypothetical protein